MQLEESVTFVENHEDATQLTWLNGTEVATVT
jgi:hypothetical protein